MQSGRWVGIAANQPYDNGIAAQLAPRRMPVLHHRDSWDDSTLSHYLHATNQGFGISMGSPVLHTRHTCHMSHARDLHRVSVCVIYFETESRIESYNCIVSRKTTRNAALSECLCDGRITHPHSIISNVQRQTSFEGKGILPTPHCHIVRHRRPPSAKTLKRKAV
jgi:hypothetical protein